MSFTNLNPQSQMQTSIVLNQQSNMVQNQSQLDQQMIKIQMDQQSQLMIQSQKNANNLLIDSNNQLKNPQNKIDKKEDPFQDESSSDSERENQDDNAFKVNLDQCYLHQQAKKIAVTVIKPDQDVCQCCGLPIDNMPLHFNCNTDELVFMGSGHPLFYKFVKMCIIQLLCIIFICGILNLQCKGTVCSQNQANNKCLATYVQTLATSNLADQEILELYDKLHIICFFVIMILQMIFIQYHDKMAQFYDDQSDFVSDWSVQVNGLDKNGTPEEIKQQIRDLFKKTYLNFEITQISLAYNTQNYERRIINLDKQIIKSKLAEFKARQRGNMNQVNLNKQKLDLLTKKKDMIYDRLHSVNGCAFNGRAFVSFQTGDQKKIAINQFKLNFYDNIKRNFKPINKIWIQDAPQPGDILWQNLGYSDQFVFWQMIKVSIQVLILIGFCSMCIYFSTVLQRYLIKNYEISDGILELMNLFQTWLIMCFNKLLSLSILYISQQYMLIFY